MQDELEKMRGDRNAFHYIKSPYLFSVSPRPRNIWGLRHGPFRHGAIGVVGRAMFAFRRGPLGTVNAISTRGCWRDCIMKRPNTEPKRPVRGRFRPSLQAFIAYDHPVSPYSVECIIDDGGKRETF
jgi:hypothetical protein